MDTAAELAGRLGATGYLADEELATVLFLALRMQRPLLLEGEPGTGKTALAEALADALELPLVRLQCYEGIDATQALFDWDFPRQILHLRALEASGPVAAEEAEKSLYDERFLLARPVLLEVLSTWQVSIPELGTVAAATPPAVVLTSNRTRELHDALKRRCLYHWIDYPSPEREEGIVHVRLPGVPDRIAERVCDAVARLRGEELYKLPGVGETIAWAQALLALDDADLESTLGVVLKVKEDIDHVRENGVLER